MKRSIKFYWKDLEKITYYEYIDELELALNGCESVLDLAFGSSSPIKHLPKTFHAVGCNMFAAAIEESKKEKGSLKFSPKTFWSIISTLTQLMVKNRPQWAFQILCVKDVT